MFRSSRAFRKKVIHAYYTLVVQEQRCLFTINVSGANHSIHLFSLKNKMEYTKQRKEGHRCSYTKNRISFTIDPATNLVLWDIALVINWTPIF